MAHLLNLVEKMCEYEMSPASIVEDTKQTRFYLQADGQTKWNQCIPLNFVGGRYN